MTLPDAQRRRVEENQNLVWKVIHERIRNPGNIPGMTMDDLFQIGCIGLCKAAFTDKYQYTDSPPKSAFSTYAYRLIYHELCSALEESTRKAGRDRCYDQEMAAGSLDSPHSLDGGLDEIEIKEALEAAQRSASGVVATGLKMLMLVADGYKYKEIGAAFGVPDNLARAYAAKARKFLREHPNFLGLKVTV